MCRIHFMIEQAALSDTPGNTAVMFNRICEKCERTEEEIFAAGGKMKDMGTGQIYRTMKGK